MPNNNQYGVAAVAAVNIKKLERIMLQVGPGLGKSRIWATLVFMLQGDFERFTVYFTSEDLMNREKPALVALKKLEFQVEVKC